MKKFIKYDLTVNSKDRSQFLQELPNKLRIELSKIMHNNIPGTDNSNNPNNNPNNNN